MALVLLLAALRKIELLVGIVCLLVFAGLADCQPLNTGRKVVNSASPYAPRGWDNV